MALVTLFPGAEEWLGRSEAVYLCATYPTLVQGHLSSSVNTGEGH